MTSRIVTTFGIALAFAVVLGIAQSTLAEEKVHEDTVVSVTAGKDGGDGKLVVTGEEDKKEHTHNISATVKIKLDGKEAKLTDLKKGDKVKVTLDGDKVTALEATRKKA